ncbi:MAG: hypothetical protein J7J06_08090 [Methanosarcinales archaeon]|nr:hypothetical protein [Methanosarcinales archaeon]
MLFKKTKGPKPISDSLMSELVGEIHKLGHDVGYHRHTEVGWVSVEYGRLIETASIYGVEETIRRYYAQGKKEGAERRKHEHLTQGGTVAVEEQALIPAVVRLSPAHRMIARPEATSAPQNIDRPKMVDRPKALDGFAPVKSA